MKTTKNIALALLTIIAVETFNSCTMTENEHQKYHGYFPRCPKQSVLSLNNQSINNRRKILLNYSPDTVALADK
jgi:hypothetical protein